MTVSNAFSKTVFILKLASFSKCIRCIYDSEVGGAEVDDFEIDDPEEMNLENLLNAVDMNELLEFEDINVEEVINAGNMEEEDYRHEFFNREEVRVQMEPLVREIIPVNILVILYL